MTAECTAPIKGHKPGSTEQLRCPVHGTRNSQVARADRLRDIERADTEWAVSAAIAAAPDVTGREMWAALMNRRAKANSWWSRKVLGDEWPDKASARVAHEVLQRSDDPDHWILVAQEIPRVIASQKTRNAPDEACALAIAEGEWSAIEEGLVERALPRAQGGDPSVWTPQVQRAVLAAAAEQPHRGVREPLEFTQRTLASNPDIEVVPEILEEVEGRVGNGDELSLSALHMGGRIRDTDHFRQLVGNNDVGMLAQIGWNGLKTQLVEECDEMPGEWLVQLLTYGSRPGETTWLESDAPIVAARNALNRRLLSRAGVHPENTAATAALLQALAGEEDSWDSVTPEHPAAVLALTMHPNA